MTPSAERIIVTGATGFLGRAVVEALRRERPEARLVLLVRAADDAAARRRVAHVVDNARGEGPACSSTGHVDVFAADITSERCGLPTRGFDAVVDGATHVIHAAATVSFDEPLATCRKVNVEGTRHLLTLAETAARRGSFRRFCHVSTAYVAGCRTGLVREDELDRGQRFRNAYEKSKLEAEVLLQQRARELPIVITRPSIIVGSAETGSTTSFKTMYWPLRVYATRRWRIVPGIPQAVIDMIPVDYVARAVAHLTLADGVAGRTFHLCAGPEGSATLGDLGALASTIFGVPPPRFVNPVVFAATVRPLAMLFLSRRRAQVLRAGRVYRPYLRMRLNFDLAGTRDVLMPAGLTPPRVADYVERLFRYCIETDWGRHPVRRTS